MGGARSTVGVTEENDMIQLHANKDHFFCCLEKRLDRDKSGRRKINLKVRVV